MWLHLSTCVCTLCRRRTRVSFSHYKGVNHWHRIYRLWSCSDTSHRDTHMIFLANETDLKHKLFNDLKSENTQPHPNPYKGEGGEVLIAWKTENSSQTHDIAGCVLYFNCLQSGTRKWTRGNHTLTHSTRLNLNTASSGCAHNIKIGMIISFNWAALSLNWPCRGAAPAGERIKVPRYGSGAQSDQSKGSEPRATLEEAGRLVGQRRKMSNAESLQEDKLMCR